MEEMVTQGSVQSALTRLEESYFVGDVIIASTAVIGSGVVLRADPGCSITIRDGVCLGPGVIIHASQGAIELHQGVCLAGGVLIVGQGSLGRQVCVGSGATLINPNLSDAAMIGADCLWGDESRRTESKVSQEAADEVSGEIEGTDSLNGSSPPSMPLQDYPSEYSDTDDERIEPPDSSETVAFESRTVISNAVIGKQQFEKMLKKMFPEREAFKRSQNHLES